MRRDIVFVHIPKTGGTSLRSLLEEFATAHTVLRDYRLSATPALHKLVREEKRIKDFRKTFDQPDKGILLSGHFPARRYWPYFHAGSFVTFLRHPVDRMISDYVAWATKRGWKGTIEEFAAPRRNKLMQSLGRVDLDAFGFIGFTEDFDATLPALGEWLGVELPLRRKNPGKYAAAGPDLRNDDRARALIAGLAAEDIAFYERLRGARSGRPFARAGDSDIDGRYVGRVRRSGTTAHGWLLNAGRECIASVEIATGGETLAVVAADLYRAGLKSKGSRSGVCGFRVELDKIVPPRRVPKQLQLSFRAQGSGYELEGSPIPFRPQAPA